MTAYAVPLDSLRPRSDGQPDATRTVEVKVTLTDVELADAFCNRGDRNQAVILNRIADNFREYPTQRDFIAMVENDGEALTTDAVLFLEALASSARESLTERQSKAVAS